MHGLRLPSFLATKKKPTATGEEDGRMMPEATDSKYNYALSPSRGSTDCTVAPREEGPPEGDQWRNHIGGEGVGRVPGLY